MTNYCDLGINNHTLEGLEHRSIKGLRPISKLLPLSLCVESTRSINPHGCNYLSQDHSIRHP
jgi:hypothetical protein